MSIAERIAALEVGHVGRGPATASARVTSRDMTAEALQAQGNRQGRLNAPALPPRAHSTENQSLQLRGPSQTSHDNAIIGNEPDYRPPSTQVLMRPAVPPVSQRTWPPILPPRKPSDLRVSHKGSVDSASSASSSLSVRRTSTASSASSAPSPKLGSKPKPNSADARSSIPGLRLPSYDPKTLPALPPKSVEQKLPPILPKRLSNGSPELEAALVPLCTTNNVVLTDVTPRNSSITPATATKAIPGAGLPRKSALEWGMNTGPAYNKSFVTPVAPPPANDNPSPIPLASRPNLSQLQASKPKPVLQPAVTLPSPSLPQACLHCRDFTGPDTHASRFPRNAIPSTDISWLSHSLTSPFPSATDKVRAIFTWLHHNIAYDTVSFFSGDLRPSTPASTISSGLAVCEGYAGLFTALALASGLECMVASGHGKGFGYVAPKNQNIPLPSFNANHAWAAVKLDDGAWKLVDPCWGAGSLCSAANAYSKKFAPQMFTMSNDEFGLRHFPTNRAQFFLPLGTPTPTWEEYLLGPDGTVGEDVQMYNVADEENLSAASFMPRKKQIPICSTSGMVRFQFVATCPHWYATRPSYVFALAREGQKLVLFQRTRQGDVWWIDVPAGELVRGQTVQCVAVTTVGGKDAKGMMSEEVGAAVGRQSMSWQIVATWVAG